MKILLVSGFLGAGKTTFIKEMAKNINLEFVVLENEYADIGFFRRKKSKCLGNVRRLYLLFYERRF